MKSPGNGAAGSARADSASNSFRKARAGAWFPRLVLRKEIVFFFQPAVLICDGLCSKAWGISNRPQNKLSDDPDDYEFLADDELGDAPPGPGTCEGGQGKPGTKRATSPETLNRWCARECERSKLLRPGEPEVLRGYATRLKNKP